MLYRDRTQAGRRLAARPELRRLTDAVVLGLPRGGVPVAYEVAVRLAAPLDVVVVRKLGVPYQPELAMGAIGEGGVRVLDEHTLRHAGLDETDVAAVERRERAELDRRVRRLRALRPRVPLSGRTAVLVDDGVATGATARAACRIARAQGAARVIVAVPVGAPEAVDRLREVADEVVCPEQPEFFMAIGEWYADFSATTETEVQRLLERAARDRVTAPAQRRPDEPEAAPRAGREPPPTTRRG
ncbi:phosphoribosyltransferase [Marinactinospora rubrisoli]|uniref:Phosphoribosyltransferase n=1 Tax=Marinactinospora rubrisoli TaxID=2715399 RepID=A0ABW2KFB4_9ACTN